MSRQLELWGESPERHNVFFAVRPNDAAASGIAGISQELATSRGMIAHILPPERLHVTLSAVGEFADSLPSKVIEAAELGADSVLMAPFTVVFDRVVTFGGGRGRRPLVLVGGDGATGLLRLHDALSLALMKVGVRTVGGGAFTPHMTLMYTDATCDMPIAPIAWTVDAFALIDSLIGQTTHRVMRQWSLRGPAG